LQQFDIVGTLAEDSCAFFFVAESIHVNSNISGGHGIAGGEMQCVGLSRQK